MRKRSKIVCRIRCRIEAGWPYSYPFVPSINLAYDKNKPLIGRLIEVTVRLVRERKKADDV